MAKKKYRILQPIGLSGRRERGEVIEIEEKDAEAIGPEYVHPYDGKIPALNVESRKPLGEQDFNELKSYAKELKISTNGKKQDVYDRIKLHLEKETEEEDDSEEDK